MKGHKLYILTCFMLFFSFAIEFLAAAIYLIKGYKEYAMASILVFGAVLLFCCGAICIRNTIKWFNKMEGKNEQDVE